MIEIDAATLAVIVTIFIAVLGLAVAWGALGQKVKRHDQDIKDIRKENREDHEKIFSKLDAINNYIRNGKVK